MNATNVSVDPAPQVAATSPRSSSRLLFWGGAALCFGVLLAYYLQVAWAKNLVTPWYLPIGGSLAVLMLLAAIARGPRWWQLPMALVAVGLAGLEWFFIVGITPLPEYSGPLKVGQPLPAFRAKLADGTNIDETYFRSDQPTAVVFFQGRWCPFCMTHLAELEQNHGEVDRAGARLVVISIDDLDSAQATQRDFPHLTILSDEQREISNAVNLINKQFGPDGQDADYPTVVLLDKEGTVKWIHRPARIITRPTAAELARELKKI